MSRVAPDGLAWSLRHRRRIMQQSTRFVGMAVHKETIVVAVTATGEVGKATAYGTFPNTAAGLEKLVKRLRQAGSGPIKFCYEAGPCGYGVHRTLTRMGEDCMVVAPSMIPRKSGERQKTDKRDAASLAVLHRGGLVDRGLGAGCGARGDARPDPRPPGGSARGASGAPAIECVSAASRAGLPRQPHAVDKGASRLASRSGLCSAGATDRAGGEH